jgi:2-succinyl-5-enolpyruvyl-6-hydroxy-3-cyclohexene-1-carboxylate synthase
MRWLGEHSNDNPRLDAFDLVFGGRAAAKLRPDFALHFGAPLTSAGWAAQLETGAICLAVVTRAHWADPQNRAQLMLPADTLQVAHALRGRLPAASESWRRLWQQASSRTAHAVEASLQELAGFAEPLVYRALDELLGEFDLLSLGNSLPVRLADSCLRSSKRQLTCLSQRGANGIDGAIASALGASSVERRPTLLVLGDVSALHDLGSLQLLKRVQHPFCVLVVNNGGGRIFEQLPAGRLPDLEPWITPHDFELWRVAAALGVSSVLVEGEAELKVALQAAARHRGATLIEARVAPSSAFEWSGAARARVEAALAEL